MPKEATPSSSSEESFTFESAMKRLEEVVAEMESGELPLETLIARHEEGARLVQVCTTLLDAARRRIDLVEEKPDGVSLNPIHAGVDEQMPSSPVRTREKKIAQQKNETNEDATALF